MAKSQLSWRSRLSVSLATCFGVGRLPYMPGTWGSLLALPLWWLLAPWGILIYLGIVVGLAAAAVTLCGQAEAALGRHDAPEIVLDEVVGQLLTLAGCSGTGGQLFLGVILFRFFDISKPFAIGWINARMLGGLGIVLDDVVAGFFAGISLAVFSRWLTL